MKFSFSFFMFFFVVGQLFYFQDVHATEQVPNSLQYIIPADESNPVNDLFLSNEKLFVNRRGTWATSYNYIDIYNVLKPSNPKLVRSNEVNCVGNDIFVHKKIVYILGPHDICAYQLNSDNTLKELYNYEFKYSAMQVENNIFKIGNRVLLNRVAGNYYMKYSTFYYIDFSNDSTTLKEYSTKLSGRMVHIDSQFLYTQK